MIAQDPCRPWATPHHFSLHPCTPPLCDWLFVPASTRAPQHAAQLSSLMKSWKKALPHSLNNGCRTIPLRRLQDWFLYSATLFVLVLCAPVPRASSLFLSHFLDAAHLYYSYTLTSTSKHPYRSALWLLERMAKPWYRRRNIRRNTISKWKRTSIF